MNNKTKPKSKKGQSGFVFPSASLNTTNLFPTSIDDILNAAQDIKDPLSVSNDTQAEISIPNLEKEISKEAAKEATGFVFPSTSSHLPQFKNDTSCSNQSDSIESSTNNQQDQLCENKIDSIDDKIMDDTFALFMNEISGVQDNADPTSSPANPFAVVEDVGTPDSICIRLTSKIFANSFDVMMVTQEATEEQIKKQYRKISLLIHPDKCQHSRAKDAFHVLLKAYEDLQKPEMRKKYSLVFEQAKKQLLKERNAENKKRKSKKEELLTTDLNLLQSEISEMCERLLKEQQEMQSYAEKCKAANVKYEQDKEQQEKDEIWHKMNEQKLWETWRDQRVNSWKDFKCAVKTKSFKIKAFSGVRHVKEEREDTKKQKVTTGVDESYKENWR